MKINSVNLYVSKYTPSVSKQNILMNQLVKEMAKELRYPDRSFFKKELKTQNLWTFEIGTQECINVPIWIYVDFQRNDRQHDQNLKIDTFCRLPVDSAQCIKSNEKYPDVGI